MECTKTVLEATTNAASLANLDRLALAGKGFTALPGLAACPRLSRLDLAGNALQSAEASCFYILIY